jgi:hypothetical protein
VCVPKNKAQQKAYGGTDNGKEKRKIQNDKESTKKLKVDYKNSDRGKSVTKEYTSTQAYLDRCKEFAKTSAGKAIRKKTYEKHRLSSNLLGGFSRIMRGGKSPNVIQLTSFRSEAHVRNHMRRMISGSCMTMKSYGVSWGCEHKIPRSAYNHDDPIDVKRCWSPENIHAMEHRPNKEKWNTIVKAIVEAVPKEFWPTSWNGTIPCKF